MPRDGRGTETLWIHERWADGMALIWMIVVNSVFAGAYFLMIQIDAEPIERIPAFILLSAVVLVICVWQVVGFAIARIELLRGRS